MNHRNVVSDATFEQFFSGNFRTWVGSIAQQFDFEGKNNTLWSLKQYKNNCVNPMQHRRSTTDHSEDFVEPKRRFGSTKTSE